MVRIRLRKVGSKNQPSYRIIAAEKENPRDGRFLENLGHYNPRTEPSSIEVDEARLFHWLRHGAQPSDAVRQLLTPFGTWDRWERFKAGEELDTLLEEAKASMQKVDPRTRRDDLAEEKRVKKTEKKEAASIKKSAPAQPGPEAEEPAAVETADIESAPTESSMEASQPQATEEVEETEGESILPLEKVKEEAPKETAEEAPAEAQERTSIEEDEEESKD